MIHVFSEQTDYEDWEVQAVIEGPPLDGDAVEDWLLKEMASEMPDPVPDDLWKSGTGQVMKEINAIKASRRAHVKKVLNGRPWNVAFADYLVSTGEYYKVDFASHDFSVNALVSAYNR